MNQTAISNEPEMEKPGALTGNPPTQDTAPFFPLSDESGEATDNASSDDSGIEQNQLEETRIISMIATGTINPREPNMKVVKRCHVGAKRGRNEDSCLVFVSETGGHFTLLPFGLYIVADGMGGHANGHLASKTASRVAARHILNKIYMPLLQSEDISGQSPIQEVLVDAVQNANTAVFQADPESDSGTTLTIALVLGRRLYMAHVGDSRAYILVNGKLEMLTTDHSLKQRLQDVGQLSAEEATYYPYSNILLRALGQNEELEVDTYMRPLPENGKLLLCSDGLSGFIPHAQMQEILSQQSPLDKIADELFESAMEAGGYDNITAVIVEFTL